MRCKRVIIIAFDNTIFVAEIQAVRILIGLERGASIAIVGEKPFGFWLVLPPIRRSSKEGWEWE